MSKTRTNYIALNRSILLNWLWTEKPFTKGQAWVDMLLNTNFANSSFVFNDRLIKVKRGELCRSEVQLAKNWGWSRNKVRRFLKILENEGQVKQNTAQGISIIRICKYADYQDSDTAVGTSDGTSDGTHNKNNIKNIYNRDLNNSEKQDYRGEESPAKEKVRAMLKSKGIL